MHKIDGLIADLSKQAVPMKPGRTPLALGLQLGGILFLYAVLLLIFLGVREDITTSFSSIFYMADIISLLAIIITSLFAVIFLSYPDQHQFPHIKRWPVAATLIFIGLQLLQFASNMDGVGQASMECALCIGSIAVVPALALFMVLYRGASVYPLYSGVYAVLAAAGVGCLVLRLSEANDSITHLVLWHYLPTLLFTAIGGMLGRVALRW